MRQAQLFPILTGAAVLALGAPASAQTVLDFDNFPAGTEVTTQYDGVTFSAEPGSCSWPIYPHIVVPGSGTSSGSKALGIQTGCPDFSPDWLRIVFDDPQRYVSFTLGEQVTPGISFQIRAYDQYGSPTQPHQNVTAGAGVFHLVQVGSNEGDPEIKRIEIQNFYDFFETIDDLTFGADPTPPTAQIDSPVHTDCICADGVWVMGIACDFDGPYGLDKLEYRAVGAAPGTPWALIGIVYNDPVCESGPLYNWNTASVPHGWYFLRLTVENACGLTDTDIVSVLVDKAFGTVEVTSPLNNQDVCGIIEFLGTVNDHCGHCFDHYTVEYAVSPNGPFYPVDPAQPTYDEIVINGHLATWDTVGNGVPDGDYYVKIRGIDDCGNIELVELVLHLDNSQPCGCPADIDEDGDVDTADLLALLGAWGACP